MANLTSTGLGQFAYIYHGPTLDLGNGDIFVNGNLVLVDYERHYYSGGYTDDIELYWYCPYGNLGWPYEDFRFIGFTPGGVPSALADNLYRVTAFNCDFYGQCHSGGSKYKLRYSISAHDENGNYAMTLNANDYVVFAPGQAYVTSATAGQGCASPRIGTSVALRMNGYIRNGVYTDTTRLYAMIDFYRHPDYTSINPY